MKFCDVWMVLPNRTIGYGDIEISGAKISAINLKNSNGASYERLVMPGLVNAHSHAPMTLVRGLGGGLPLQRWLEEAIFPVEAKMTKDDVYAGAVWGAMEMLSSGTTTVADMYDFPSDCARAFEETGIKANLARVGLSFIDGRIKECIDFTRNFSAKNVVADICIHSEYLTDEKFCRELAAANREFKRPLNVHVSETKKEHEECIARHGKTPMQYLAATGILDYGGYAAHCVYATDDDFKVMREMGVTLVHNPTSNMKLGSGFARTPEAIAQGVNVALGTDGTASNDNLDMFEEMHLASLLHKGRLKDPTIMGAWDVIEMATVNGAKALNRDCSGELKVGDAADLCVIDLKKPHLMPVLDIPNLIVHSMHGSDVVMTIVNGDIVYDRGQWLKIDQGRAEFDFKVAVRNLGL